MASKVNFIRPRGNKIFLRGVFLTVLLWVGMVDGLVDPSLYPASGLFLVNILKQNYCNLSCGKLLP